MLVAITNRCSAHCSHCMQGSTPSGEHMSEDVFRAALDLTERVEHLAWKAGAPRLIVLTGGECTEHPQIVQMVERVIARGMTPMLLSNGQFLGDAALRSSLLRPEWPQISVQVTYDPRFYPKAPPPWDDARLFASSPIPALLPLGRARTNKALANFSRSRAPSSFNLRAITRSLGNIDIAVAHLRLRAAEGRSGACIPSVSEAGDVMAGETRSCFKIGTVYSTNRELTASLLRMKCNACGLENNLTATERQAIGAGP